MMKVRKALITAGGWGTRFLPLSKSLPKEMLPLLNKPLLQYAVEEAIACGVELVVIVSSKEKRCIEDYFDRNLELERMLRNSGRVALLEEVLKPSCISQICYVRQQGQMGLGHAVLAARKAIGDEPFILILPDDLFQQRETVLRNMIDIYQRFQGSVVAVKRIGIPDISRYGVIKPEYIAESVYRVIGLEEKPHPGKAPSDLAIMGRYVLSPEIFEALEHTPPGHNGEIQLTDALQLSMFRNPVFAYEFPGDRYDTGSLPGWIETMVAFAVNDPEIGPGLRNRIYGLLSGFPDVMVEQYVGKEKIIPPRKGGEKCLKNN
jgi:UTP--glucose-1-phosphate uridylyltransferase